MYVGYENVYKSKDGGVNWEIISQKFDERLDHLKIAPSDNSIIYAAYDHKLFKNNNLEKWSELTGFSGHINSIAIHPKDPNKIAIATNSKEKVYVSTDGGYSWKSYLKNLPDFSALSLVWQDNHMDGLYLGMNYGVYYIDNSSTEWENFNNNLPNVMINELEINYADNRLYAATYGRGIWSSPVFDKTLSTKNNNLLTSVKIFPNPSVDFINIQLNKQLKTSIRLYDLKGQMIYFSKDISSESTYQMQTHNLTSGTYFLKINNKNGTIIKKIIKK